MLASDSVNWINANVFIFLLFLNDLYLFFFYVTAKIVEKVIGVKLKISIFA
ncbi:hypothetical protein JCM10003_2940 [Bacteroides pyogenes JCM 10003]|nr:hypothetical protein JCM10003_2940 [Bacteroides pyogenes JCM 10003]